MNDNAPKGKRGMYAPDDRVKYCKDGIWNIDGVAKTTRKQVMASVPYTMKPKRGMEVPQGSFTVLPDDSTMQKKAGELPKKIQIR